MKKILPIIVGLLAIAIGIFCIIYNNSLTKRCTEKVTATIIEIIEEQEIDEDNHVSYTYYPILRYEVNERPMEQRSSSNINTNKYKVGDKLNIMYNPNKPEEFIIDGEKHLLYIGLAAIIGGIIFLVVGCVELIKNR